MPRKYIKKKNPTYTLETLKQAINDVKSGILNAYQASRKYAIPRMTIVDRIKLRRGIIKDTKGRPTRIDPMNEKRLADGLRTMEKYGFGLSSKETITVVTHFIKQNKIKTDFKNDIPGYDWFAGFCKRNNLSLKKPQAVELSRKAACDPFIIKDYFNTLEICMKTLKITDRPEKIWNLDESSFSKDPEKTKVVGARGFASTRTIASAGKDNVTVLFTVNAVGEKLPPLIIFRGKNVWDKWMSDKAFEGTSYAATKNGWIESKVFEKYMLKTVLPHLSKESPCLLVYDGHTTHIQLNILENAAKMGVTIIKLPSHASHLLQPLDLAVFKSMKDRWDAKILSWQRQNVGGKLQKDQFSQILGEVWQELDPQIIRNGFKKGGIYPLNKNAIPDEKFDPDTLERFLTANSQKTPKKVPNLLNLCLKVVNNTSIQKKQAAQEERKNKGQQQHITIQLLKPSETIVHGTGTGPSYIQVIENKQVANKTFESLLLETIKKSENVIKVKKRKVAKGCEIITHETFLEKLRSEEKDKKEKENKKENKNKEKMTKKSTKIDIKSSKAKKSNKTKKQSKSKKIYLSEDSSDDDDDDVVLSDDSHLDWNTYCEYLHQEDQENAGELMDEQDTGTFEENISSNDTPDNIIHNNLGGKYETNINPRYAKVDDWLLVKFATKKTVKHFVGNVISMIDRKPNVKYLRLIRNSKIQSFHYPDVEDISEVRHDSDIVMFLEKPVITRRGHIIFKENLKSYNIQ